MARKLKSKIPVFAPGLILSDTKPVAYYSKGRAAKFLAMGRAWEPYAGVIQLVVTIAVRTAVGRVTRIPALRPPGPPELLMLTYPPVPQETGGRERQKELWRTATRF